MCCGFFLTFCNKSMMDPEPDEKKEVLTNKLATVNEVPPYCYNLADPCSDPACKPFFDCPEEFPVQYAGVDIVYEVNSDILRFNSAADLETVLNQLDVDYETHNNNYENTYPTLTPEQLDDMDEVTGFDEFATFRNFENLFAPFTSKRAEIEAVEELWLSLNMTGTNPSDLDNTFDNAENTILNANHEVKIGSTVYTLSSDIVSSMQSPLLVGCVTNKRKKKPFVSPDQSRKFEVKVALNTWFVRSGAKGKVVSYVKKGNRWKRSRTHLGVYVNGTIYNNVCTNSFQFSARHPASGFKKRKELKVVNRQFGTIWKTYPGQLGASFEASGIVTGGVAL